MTVLTLEQAARNLGIPPQRLKSWVSRNPLDACGNAVCLRVGRRMVFEQVDLDRIATQMRLLTRQKSHPERLGDVYFVTCERPMFPIKIGFAADLRSRMTSLQVSMPWPIKLLVALEGKLADEEMLHRKFAHLRMEGEWFYRHEDILGVVKLIRSFAAAIVSERT
jgi:hypothetical protein